MNLYANDNIDVYQPSYGGVDSVKIAISDIRIVNSKLVELEYEKKINTNLREVVRNDSIIIRNHEMLQKQINKDLQKVTLQRNIFIGTSVALTVVGILVGTFILVR